MCVTAGAVGLALAFAFGLVGGQSRSNAGAPAVNEASAKPSVPPLSKDAIKNSLTTGSAPTATIGIVACHLAHRSARKHHSPLSHVFRSTADNGCSLAAPRILSSLPALGGMRWALTKQVSKELSALFR